MSRRTAKKPYNYGKRLKEMMDAQLLRQKDICESTGFSPGFINDIIKGRTRPSLELMEALYEVYGFSTNWIVLGVGPMGIGKPDQVEDEDNKDESEDEK